MYKLWPSPVLFALAAMLLLRGCSLEDSGKKRLAEHPPISAPPSLTEGRQVVLPDRERDEAKRDTETGFGMQIGGGVLAVIGAVLFGLGMLHQQVQSQALAHRLAVTYDFVAVVPSEGAMQNTDLLTEDQAVDQLQTRYPSLAKSASEKLRREFAEKRRAEPTKIWYVKDFQVREVKG